MNNKEEFRSMPSYKGLYEVSNLGNVKSLDRYVKHSKGGLQILKGRVLTPTKASHGYLTVGLCREGKRKTFTIHQLVAMCFLGHKPNKYSIICDHINNNPLDNRVENLQIITQRENASKDKKTKGCSSQYVGVTLCKNTNKWYSAIQINGKMKYLGKFINELEAAEAYNIALKNII